MKKITVAIDGFSGTGKSSTAKIVAEQLGYIYIDSGAMYRACTLHFLDNDVDYANSAEVEKELSSITIGFVKDIITLNGTNVSSEIRSMRVNEKVSQVSAVPIVREAMVAQQREIGKDGGIVIDGRDIGTVVFPAAELKVFMSANSRVRAERRHAELQVKGIVEELSIIEKNLIERDRLDSTREISPLKKAEGAVEIDTSDLSFDQQVERIVSLAKSQINES